MLPIEIKCKITKSAVQPIKSVWLSRREALNAQDINQRPYTLWAIVYGIIQWPYIGPVYRILCRFAWSAILVKWILLNSYNLVLLNSGTQWTLYCTNWTMKIKILFWKLSVFMVASRARGTDFVRLCPASASVRFLDIFPVRRPNSSLRRTIGLRPPSAFVRFQIFLASDVRIRPWGGPKGSVRRPFPSALKIFWPSCVRIRP